MNKEELLKDLQFILSKYENNLETELYPITNDNTQEDLEIFQKYISQIIENLESSLEVSDYSDEEYSKILLEIIQKIETKSHFQNSSNKDKTRAEQIINTVSKEIKKAI